MAVRNYLYDKCDNILTLKQEGVDCWKLRAKMDEVWHKARPAQNRRGGDLRGRQTALRPQSSEIPDITFSISRWLQSGADSIRKAGIVLHEFLGLMKLEATDDYPISSRVLNELRAHGTVALPTLIPEDLIAFKKWADEFIKTGNGKRWPDPPYADDTVKGSLYNKANGRTSTGKKCVLFVTSKQEDVAAPVFYLSLGVGPKLGSGKLRGNFYIGGFVDDKADLQISGHEMKFRWVRDAEAVSEGKSGKPIYLYRLNDLKLKVEFTDSGRPFRATGSSSIFGNTICNLK